MTADELYDAIKALGLRPVTLSADSRDGAIGVMAHVLMSGESKRVGVIVPAGKVEEDAYKPILDWAKSLMVTGEAETPPAI